MGSLLLVGQIGCVFVVPTVPLPGPGDNLTYRVVDDRDRPIPPTRWY